MRGFRMMKKVLDPQGRFLHQWDKIFVFSCIVALSLDPWFFYIFVADNNKKCLDVDNELKVIVCILRSLTDLCYMFHILVQYCTGNVAPIPEAGFLEIAKRYLFIADIYTSLPLPQVVVLIIAPRVPGRLTRKLLLAATFSQYIPRLFRICSMFIQKIGDSRIFPDSRWANAAGAAFNLFLYMQASNVLGAVWYMCTIVRVHKCWRDSCANRNCNSHTLYCGGHRVGDFSFLNSSCAFVMSGGIAQPGDFDFGMFLEALQSEVVEHRDFWQKFFRCFWWGLRNLSSMGQNISTSKYVWEAIFAIIIAVMGLVLFTLLIGNMQKYMQSISVRQAKKRDKMSERHLPKTRRCRVRRYQRGSSLPVATRTFRAASDMECLALRADDLRSVASRLSLPGMFHLRYYSQQWRRWSACCIQAAWRRCFRRRTRAACCIQTAWRRYLRRKREKSLHREEDRFMRLHTKKTQNYIRFYSLQWRTSAACHIQIAWRRYARRKQERLLCREEDRLRAVLAAGSISTSQAVTILFK